VAELRDDAAGAAGDTGPEDAWVGLTGHSRSRTVNDACRQQNTAMSRGASAGAAVPLAAAAAACSRSTARQKKAPAARRDPEQEQLAPMETSEWERARRRDQLHSTEAKGQDEG
jgi:hypothetical protein